MSELEIQRRQEYKRNRKKWTLIQLTAIILLAIISLGLFIGYNRMNQTHYIEYKEAGSVNYKVHYKDNEFFEDEWIDMNQSYISSLTDGIKANFNYALGTGSSDMSFDYNYSINAKLVISKKDVGTPYYTYEEIILPTTEAAVNGSSIKVNETVSIDYNKFDTIARNFITTYNLKNATAVLVVSLNVSTSTGNANFDQKIQNSYFTSLNIPLAEDNFNISRTSSATENESKLFEFNSRANRDVLLVLAIIAGMIWGTIRGLKKQTFRLGWILVTAVVLFFLTPVITRGLMNVNLGFLNINISGVKLTDQELLNINYVGSWLADAKGWFSKNNCQALSIGKDYVKGIAIRQELLELALEWICEYQGIKSIDRYMARHQHDANATELWLHFNKVIEWVKAIFPTYRKEMKGLDWGRLYFEYGNEMYDTNELEKQISTLMADDDVTNKKGVYEYVLSRRTKERVLSVRTFSDRDKRTAYEKQNGICSICGEHFELNEMQADHIIEWSKGGKTTIDNLQMVCHKCHKDLTRTLHD